jgi:hypothetical protein
MVEEFTRAFDRLALIEKDLFLSICPATLADHEVAVGVSWDKSTPSRSKTSKIDRGILEHALGG